MVRKKEVLSGLGTAMKAVSLQGQQRTASKTYPVRGLVTTKSITGLMCVLAFWQKLLPGKALLRTVNEVLVELGKPASYQAKSEAMGG